MGAEACTLCVGQSNREVGEGATQVGTRSRFVGTELAAPLQPLLTPYRVSTRSRSFGSCEGWSFETSLVIQAEPGSLVDNVRACLRRTHKGKMVPGVMT